jgi:RHS repeat-associated protein
VKAPGGATEAVYGYDGLGRRVQVTEGGTTTDLYYSDQWQVVEERVSGTTTAQYVWGAQYVDELIERDRGAERLYAQQDANWNVTALLDTTGAAVERYLEDPFGVTTYLTGSWGSRSSSAYAWQYNHLGGRLDTVTGDYNFRNREYRPSIGRWQTDDPIRYNAGDSNLYRYVRNEPTNATDPSGLQQRASSLSEFWNDQKGDPRNYQRLLPPKEGWLPPTEKDVNAKFQVRALAVWELLQLSSDTSELITKQVRGDKYITIIPNVDGLKAVVYYRKVLYTTTKKGIPQLKGDPGAKEEIIIGRVGGWGQEASVDTILQFARNKDAADNCAAAYWGYKATWVPLWRTAIHILDKDWEAAAL